MPSEQFVLVNANSVTILYSTITPFSSQIDLWFCKHSVIVAFPDLVYTISVSDENERR